MVGLIFDGNIQSLVLDFVYTDEQARAVAVCRRPSPSRCVPFTTPVPLADELVTGRRK